jgi:hypothetical protein
MGCGSGDTTYGGSSEEHYDACYSLAGSAGCWKGKDYYGQPYDTCAIGIADTTVCSHDRGDPPSPTPERPYPYTWTGCTTSVWPLNPTIGCVDGYEPGPGGEAVRVSYCIVTVGQITCRYDRLSGNAGCDPVAAGRRSKMRLPPVE